MAYCTRSDVRLALAPYVDNPAIKPDDDNPTNTAADLDNATLDAAIEQASSQVDAYLGGRYAVPIAPGTNGKTPATVFYVAIALASYFATLTWRKGQDLTDGDPVVRRYLNARQELTDMSTGRITLALPSQGGDQALAGAGAPLNPYVGNLFTSYDFELRANPWPYERPWLGVRPW